MSLFLKFQELGSDIEPDLGLGVAGIALQSGIHLANEDTNPVCPVGLPILVVLHWMKC